MTFARSLASVARRRRFLTGLTALALAPLTSGCGGGGSDAGGPGIPGGPTVPPAPGVDGPAWWGFGRDAQHTALSATRTQDLNRIAWRTPLDLAPQYRGGSGALLTHYGSPVISSHNTVVLPVKTGAAGGFRIEARSGVNGGPIWSAVSDYVLPAHNWIPSYNLALTTGNRLYAPGAGGKLLVKADADSPTGTLQTAVFFGAAAYAAAPAIYDACVFINTPVTVDSLGNVFFGFVVTAANPAGLESGIARIGADGVGSWVSARLVSGDAGVAKVATNSAPALSNDLGTLYVAANANPAGTVQGGYLLALDSVTLALRNRALLIDPGSGSLARVSDDSTASPTVGPDGDVYFGVLETVFGTHNGRGWLLHYDATLATRFVPGGFGWDDTASIVPASIVPSYAGSAPYLLMVKYNNYLGAGYGDGANRVAIVDPRASQTDPFSGLPIMREVLTLLGPTFESGNSGPVVEWCINTAAVDPFTRSVLVNSEDGYLYRWDLVGNTANQRIQLTSGIGESYTPTAIGADGAVYAVNNAVLFSIAR